MNGHSDSEERNALLLGTRTSGGGFSPSEAFREVLSFLHDNQSATTDVLHKVIREQKHIAFNDKRVLEVWGTWDAFCQVILDVLAEGGFIISGDGVWRLGSKAVPGRSLTVIRLKDEQDTRLRVSFLGEKQRVARERIAEARIKMEDLIWWLQGVRDLDPVLRKAHDKAVGISAMLQASGGTPQENEDGGGNGAEEETTRQGRFRPHGQITIFTDRYMKEHRGKWVTTKQVALAYDREYPPGPGQTLVAEHPGSIIKFLHLQVKSGRCESRLWERPASWRYLETGTAELGV